MNLSGTWDWVCLSPKKNKNASSKKYMQEANELKNDNL